MTKFYLKPSFKSLKRTVANCLLVLITLVTAVSCGKDDTVATPIGLLSVYNTSPTAATYDVYLGSTKFNSAALPFGGGTTYVQLSPGTQTIKLNVADRGESIFSKNIDIAQNTYQTYYFIDRPDKIDGLLINDDLSATSSDKAFVRFINVAPDAPSLDLFLAEATSALHKDKTYKGYSNFTPIAAGSQIFEIKESGNGTKKANSESTTLVAGRYYTVLAKGLINPLTSSENGFSLQVITHQ